MNNNTLEKNTLLVKGAILLTEKIHQLYPDAEITALEPFDEEDIALEVKISSPKISPIRKTITDLAVDIGEQLGLVIIALVKGSAIGLETRS